MIRRIKQKNFSYFLLFFIAVLVLSSLLLHAIQVHHAHPQAFFGESVVAAYLHSGDTKRLLAAVLLASALVTLLVLLTHRVLESFNATATALLPWILSLETALVSDPFLKALKRGSLRRKTCE